MENNSQFIQITIRLIENSKFSIATTIGRDGILILDWDNNWIKNNYYQTDLTVNNMLYFKPIEIKEQKQIEIGFKDGTIIKTTFSDSIWKGLTDIYQLMLNQ